MQRQRSPEAGSASGQPHLALVHGDAPDPWEVAELERRSHEDLVERLAYWIARLPEQSAWRKAYVRGREDLERAEEEER